MLEILVSHPLSFVYSLYVVGVILVAFWLDTPRLPGRQNAPEPWGALGERRQPRLGSSIIPPTTSHFLLKEEKL
jgi:hypothetical protein